jgi:hypothetical protein
VLWLASDEAKYVTCIALAVDAGMTVQPPGISEQLETLLGRPPKTVGWALENHPRIRKMAAA